MKNFIKVIILFFCYPMLYSYNLSASSSQKIIDCSDISLTELPSVLNRMLSEQTKLRDEISKLALKVNTLQQDLIDKTSQNDILSQKIDKLKDSFDVRIEEIQKYFQTRLTEKDESYCQFRESLAKEIEGMKGLTVAQLSKLQDIVDEIDSRPTIGYPDFSKGQNMLWDTNITASCNGWIFVHTIDDWDPAFTVFVNGKTVLISHKPRNRESGFFPVMQGQIYKASGGTGEVKELIFYPCL